jgi:hypothetical protein
MIHTLVISHARRIKDVDKNSILLDIDKAKLSLHELFIKLRLVRITPTFIQADRTRRGWHIIIGTKHDLKPLEKIALQAILGSDQRREALNYFRYKNKVFLNLLFEPK